MTQIDTEARKETVAKLGVVIDALEQMPDRIEHGLSLLRELHSMMRVMEETDGDDEAFRLAIDQSTKRIGAFKYSIGDGAKAFAQPISAKRVDVVFDTNGHVISIDGESWEVWRNRIDQADANLRARRDDA